MSKPLRTLNKRRRRAERRDLCDMYIVTSKRTVHIGGNYYALGNTSWKWRTKRSPRYRRKPYVVGETLPDWDGTYTAIGGEFTATGSYDEVLAFVRDAMSKTAPDSPTERT